MLKQLGLQSLVGKIENWAEQLLATPVTTVEEDQVIQIDVDEVVHYWQSIWQADWWGPNLPPNKDATDGAKFSTYEYWMSDSAPINVEQHVQPVDSSTSTESTESICTSGENDKWHKRGVPKYVRYTSDINQAHVVDLIRFRCGSHDLKVVTGRWQEVERKHRVCTKCLDQAVEDEMHVVLKCQAYEPLRSRFYKLFEFITNRSDEEKFDASDDLDMRSFMNQHPRLTAYFIHLCLKARRELPDIPTPSEDLAESMLEGWLADIDFDMFDSEVDEPCTHTPPPDTTGATIVGHDGVDAYDEADEEELQLWIR
jgi:hypothetical protein